MARLSQEDTQRILDSTDIVELIQSYFPLKRAGVNFTAVCPFHSEKTPSFNVSPQRQAFYCFGCHAGGDAIKFVMMYDNLPFVDAARRLADQAGIVIREEVLSQQELAAMQGRRDLARLQQSAADWFHQLLFKSPAAQDARQYLQSRQFGMEVAREWKFGYAPEESGLFHQWVKQKGFSNSLLVTGGLAKCRVENQPHRGVWPFFRHRLMFPINNHLGEAVAFSGRVLSPEQKGGKYINSPESPLFNKSKTLFGLDKTKRAIIREKRAILCEGQLDLISAYHAGVHHVVAPLGTAFTEEHAKALKRITDEVVLCFDSDNAGLNAASKAFRMLAPSGILVRLALLPEGEDPDSLIRRDGVDAFREILETAPEFFDFHIDRRGGVLSQGSLRDRLGFARDLATDIALIKDKMLQDALINRVTVRLGVGDEEIRKLVRDGVQLHAKTEKHRRKREQSHASSPPTGGRPDQGPANSEGGSPSSTPASSTPTEIQNRSVRLLILALLTEAPIRDALSPHPVPTYFQNVPETELLVKIWMAPLDLSRPATVNAWLAGLSDGEQRSIHRILSDERVKVTPDLANQCLAALEKQSLQQRIAALKARMSAPQLPASELVALGKQLLDLRAQLNDR